MVQSETFECLTEDLEHIYTKTRHFWNKMFNKTIFVTGGTGFFGMWLQMSFLYINKKLELNAKMIILTRDKNAFIAKYPFVKDNEEISFVEGDITSFPFPDTPIDYIIHAATEASAKLNRENPLQMFDTIVGGTRRVLDFASTKKIKSFLLTSSGAVYGTPPADIKYVNEQYKGAPDTSDPVSIYGESKRMAELLCTIQYKNAELPVKIARCYAFVGPFLPLDTHFAIGNFIKNVLDEENIIIEGDGTTIRSYMYAADLMIWLWTILFNGKDNYPYNVGSDLDVNIEQLANIIAKCGHSKNDFEVIIKKQKNEGVAASRYVPSIDRAKRELNLDVYISLDEAIKKTIRFHQSKLENIKA